MPLQATSGAASYDGFGGGVAAVPQYIEDVFSSYLWTSTGSNVSISNGIDLSTKGGLVWEKCRSVGVGHTLTDTARGVNKTLETNSTAAESTGGVQTFSTDGFTTSANIASRTFVGWTFREQPKFFDIVTFTAGSSTNRRISHSLGSVPGFIVVKVTSATGSWYCYHRSLGISKYTRLNATSAESAYTNVWGTSAPTSTDFGVDETALFNSGESVVAYLFAHDAGGFGLTGTDNVISCGSFTVSGSRVSIDLGYEPQWLLIKESSTTGNWRIVDSMRGIKTNSDGSGEGAALLANTSGTESDVTPNMFLTATGFTFTGGSATYIYIAIRRGPMKVPTTGTSVFNPNTSVSTLSSGKFGVTTGFPVDMLFWRRTDDVSSSLAKRGLSSRLTGSVEMQTDTTNAEASNSVPVFDYSTQVAQQSGNPTFSQIFLSFQRAPSFFDEVCYTGDGASNRVLNHNLGTAPEMMLFKRRGPVGTFVGWLVYHAGMSAPNNDYVSLNSDGAKSTLSGIWGTPTASTFTLGIATTQSNGASPQTYVAYLFATCAGVSKVGSYTGTGTTLQIDCGFTGGARFVLIKRTNSASSDWYVWDSARGIVAGNDPYLLLNTTDAEVTSTDYIDTYSAGFEISSTAPAAINGSGDSFIFLAIA